jgi:hypothetical protein
MKKNMATYTRPSMNLISNVQFTRSKSPNPPHTQHAPPHFVTVYIVFRIHPLFLVNPRAVPRALCAYLFDHTLARPQLPCSIAWTNVKLSFAESWLSKESPSFILEGKASRSATRGCHVVHVIIPLGWKGKKIACLLGLNVIFIVYMCMKICVCPCTFNIRKYFGTYIQYC